MSEYQDDQRLREMLETATARRLPDGTLLNGEASELREGWLALDEMLTQAEEPIDVPRLLDGVRPMRRKRVARMVALAAGVLAASLFGSLALLRQQALEPVEPSGQEPSRMASRTTLPKPNVDAAPEAPAQAIDSAWDDSLDSRIAQVREHLVRTRRGWTSDRRVYTILRQRLDEFHQSLEQEPL